MVAGIAAGIGIAGTAATAISRKRHKRSRADGIAFSTRPLSSASRQPSVRTDIDLALSHGCSERPGRSSTRTDQRTDAGSQGGPLSQGAVANAPTAGARWQRRSPVEAAPGAILALASNAGCREATWLSRAIAGVASMAAAISAADKSLNLVIRFLHWDCGFGFLRALQVWRATGLMRWPRYSASIRRLDRRSVYSDELRLPAKASASKV